MRRNWRKAVLLDVSPLKRSVDFRRLWVSGLVSGLGGQIGLFGIIYQVFMTSGDTLAVGLLGLTVLIPQLVLSPVGGLVADRVDRRRILIVTGIGLTVCATALMAYGLVGSAGLWPVYCLATAQTVLGSLAVPARRAIVRQLLPASLMPAGSALSLLSMHVVSIAGPAAGGIIAASLSVPICYGIDAVSYVFALHAVWRLPRQTRSAAVGEMRWRDLFGGFTFLGRHAVVRSTLLCDGLMTVLGVPVALFPAMNAAFFGGQPQTLGALTSAIAVGGVLGAVVSGFTSRVRHQGAALAVCAMGWGSLVGLLGTTHRFDVTVVLLGLTGVLDVFCLTLAKTIVQNETPDEFRGRVSAVEFLVSMGGPQLGNVRAGVVATLLPLSGTCAVGGLSAAVAVGLLALLQPQWRRYVRREEPTPDSAANVVDLSAPGHDVS